MKSLGEVLVAFFFCDLLNVFSLYLEIHEISINNEAMNAKKMSKSNACAIEICPFIDTQ